MGSGDSGKSGASRRVRARLVKGSAGRVLSQVTGEDVGRKEGRGRDCV